MTDATARDVIAGVFEQAEETMMYGDDYGNADLILSALLAASESMRLELMAIVQPPGYQFGPINPWRKIETAPKDGTKLLGFAPHPLINDPKFRVVCMWWKDTRCRGAGSPNFDWCSSENGSLIGKPTHWLPLPAPPASED